MRWARRILIAISAIVAVLGVATALLVTMDLSRFKGNLESYVSKVTGRELIIAGAFKPSVGTTIDLVAGNVRLTNAAWGTADNILELERLVISVDTWSLLFGPIEVLDLQAEGVVLHFEKEPERRLYSWSFRDKPKVAKDVHKARKSFELPLWLKHAQLQDIEVTYGQGWLEKRHRITASELNLREDEGGLLRMVMSGAIDDEPISATGLVGPLRALLDGYEPRWELDVSVGDFQASTQGTFDDLFKLKGPRIHAAMQGSTAELILASFGLPPVGRGPVDLKAELTEDQDGLALRIDGAFGDLISEISGRADSLRAIRKLDLSVNVRGPDVQAVGALFGAGFLPPAEFVVEGGIDGLDDTLILNSMTLSVGDARLEVDGKLASLERDPDAQLVLSASGAEIREFLPASFAEKVPSGPFDIRAVAVGGMQQTVLRELHGGFGEHDLVVEGVLPVSADMTGLDITATARGPDFDEVVGPWAEKNLAAAPYVANARVRNDGAGYVVDDLALEVADASLRLAGTTGILPTLEGLDASLDLSGENLQEMMTPWPDSDLPAVPFGIEGDFIVTNGALEMSNVVYRVGDARGTLDGTTGELTTLDGFLVRSSLTGPDASEFVAMFGDPENSTILPALAFQTDGTISRTSAGWFAKPWTMQVGESRFEMNGEVSGPDGATAIDVDVVASGPDLRQFLPEIDVESPVPYEFGGGIRVNDDVFELREAELRLGNVTGRFDGRLPAGAELTDVELDFRVAGPDLQLAGQAFGFQGLVPDAFDFQGTLSRAEQAYKIDDLSVVVGENKLDGRINLEMGSKVRLTGELDSEHLDLTSLSPGTDVSPESDEDAPDPPRIIPDTPLPLHLMDVADIDMTLRLQAFRTEGLDIGDVELKIVLEDDNLHVETGRVALTNGGTMNGSFNLVRSGNEQADVQVNIVGEQYTLRPMVGDDGDPIDRPLEDLKLDLSGTGRTTRELAGSADGSISLRQGEGEIDNQFRGYLIRDFASQLFAAVNPSYREEKYTLLQCGFLEVDVVDGVARSRALGLQTDRLTVASVGAVDFATEALDLSFRIKQRKGIGVSIAGIVNPYVKVGGTMASPALEFDKKRGFFSSTAAVFTGGLSILAQGVWDRYMSRDDYCEAVIEAVESGEIPIWDGDPDG